MGSTKRIVRDWSAARAKVVAEGVCRVCGAGRPQAAHLLGRRHDRAGANGDLRVDSDEVVPLCEGCHRAYDGRRLDLVPHLTRAEQARAVGLVAALRRVSGGARRDERCGPGGDGTYAVRHSGCMQSFSRYITGGAWDMATRVKRATVNLDADLLEEAARALGTVGTTATLNRALDEVVRRRRLDELAATDFPELTLEGVEAVRRWRTADPA